MFADEDSLRGKTSKIGHIARSASVFGVERIYIYRDMSGNNQRSYETARTILEYAETPQYLRKRLIGKKADLEFAGLIPPLKIPHHLKTSRLVEGEIREAVVVLQNSQIRADVGARELAFFEARGQPGQRRTVKISSVNPPTAVSTDRPEGIYWGYEVRRAPSLARFLRGSDFELVILTSHLGELLSKNWMKFVERVRSVHRILICFGSPNEGVHSILKQENSTVEEFHNALVLNMFPSQNVQTVRLEEAILGSLSIINLARHL